MEQRRRHPGAVLPGEAMQQAGAVARRQRLEIERQRADQDRAIGHRRIKLRHRRARFAGGGDAVPGLLMRGELDAGGLAGREQHQPVETIVAQARGQRAFAVAAQVDHGGDAEIRDAREIGRGRRAMLAGAPQHSGAQPARRGVIAAIVAEIMDAFEA